ncbi:MAG: tRNA (adenosine(37)-N6)-dimethylallyltransferase MiaA, partial [Syntrophomonadaceae bacterium]|nr:tRNA (adenosine(37)-N6)-dimethylallyltransferase MiaA [Syntrophomonadaceae bacterium]
MLKLAAIVGPTAVGKTGTALKTAQLNGAEIISCDSMQVYRGMDIGTAKVTPEEQALVPHHLIDIVNIDEEYNVARYQKETARLIQTLNQQDRLPLLVGGTGLYYQAVVDNYQLMPLEASPELRDEYKQEISIKGIDHVYRQLQKIDPAYADKISPRDEK